MSKFQAIPRLPQSCYYFRHLGFCSMSLSRTNTNLFNRRRHSHNPVFSDVDLRPRRSRECRINYLPVAGRNSASTENPVFVVVRLQVPILHLGRFCYLGSISEADEKHGRVRRQQRALRHWSWLRGLNGVLMLILHSVDGTIVSQIAAKVFYNFRNDAHWIFDRVFGREEGRSVQCGPTYDSFC